MTQLTRTGGDVATRLRGTIARTERLLARQTTGSLTRTQFSVLGALARAGRLRLAVLVEREGVNPTMLSRIVGALEADGLLARSPDPDDGRAVVLEVTDAGRELYQRLQGERAALIEDYLRSLPPAQNRRLVEALPVLEGLAQHLHDGAAAGRP
ncbi:MAG TPA: MarR family transcriptional regulator [Mycobacteriales bacterium]|jgi:DNA-binding MarR family transcriptional regulator|nr:MarR family transcriptional regulator [Mycobacteriales bacterium]